MMTPRTATRVADTLPSPSDGLHTDQRGAMMVAGMFMGFIACGFLWYLVGVGNALLYREGIQDSADAVAFTGAVLHARGMTIIVLINMVMTALMAILILLRALETLLIATMVICGILAAIPWTAAFGFPCVTFAEEALQPVQNAANEVDDILAQVLPPLNAASRGLSMVYPWVAEGRAYQHAQDLGERNEYNGGLQLGFIYSKSLFPKGPSDYRVGLPIEEDTDGYWGRTGQIVKYLVLQAIPGAFGSVIGSFLEGASTVTDVLGYRAHKSRGKCPGFKNECGTTQEQPEREERKLSADDFQDNIDKACDQKRDLCNQGDGDTFTFKETAFDPVSGGALTDGEGPVMTGDKRSSDMQYCHNRPKPPEYDTRCERPLDCAGAEPKGFCDYPETCPLSSIYTDENPYNADEAYVDGVYFCWDHPEKCSDTDEDGQRYTNDAGSETDEFGQPILKVQGWQHDEGECQREEKKKMQQKLDEAQSESGGSGSGSGNSNKCEAPKKFFCKIEHAGDGFFQVFSVVQGKKPPLGARQGVRVAVVGEDEDWKDEGLGQPLQTLAQYGTAQAEYYFDGNDWANIALWQFKWKARMRRFLLPPDIQDAVEKIGEVLSLLGLATGGVDYLNGYIADLQGCAANSDVESVDACMDMKLEPPINRFQIIH
jgi:hypothetical protein